MLPRLSRRGNGLFGRLGTYILLLTIFGASIFFQIGSVLHHDPAWIIHGTDVFLGGGKLYKDVFELNPPLIFYLTVPPIWLARLFNLAGIDIFICYVFILIVISMSVVWVLQYSTRAPSPSRNGTLLAIWVALAIYPAGNFGQREHLMLILSFPYLFLVGKRAQHSDCSGLLAVGIGILATLGFGLKPHFLLVPSAAELYLVVRTRSIRRCVRPETVTLASGILIYFVAILVFTPDYMTTIVPFGMEVYDVGFASPIWVVLDRLSSVLLPIILLRHFVLRHRERTPELGDVLSIAAICFFVIYVVQMKGWSYQAYPLNATLFFLLSIMLLDEIAQTANPSRIMGVVTIASALLLAAMTTLAASHRYHNSFMTAMAPIVSKLPRGSSIYVFTARVSEGFPLVNYYDVGWASRFDTLWLLPGLIAQASPSPRIEQFLRDAVAYDIATHAPTLIFVDDAPEKLYFHKPFDYITYFSTEPRFAEIWSAYDEIGPVGNFRLFRRHFSSGDGT